MTECRSGGGGREGGGFDVRTPSRERACPDLTSPRANRRRRKPARRSRRQQARPTECRAAGRYSRAARTPCRRDGPWLPSCESPPTCSAYLCAVEAFRKGWPRQTRVATHAWLTLSFTLRLRPKAPPLPALGATAAVASLSR